jgi:hypothetical protein
MSFGREKRTGELEKKNICINQVSPEELEKNSEATKRALGVMEMIGGW